MKPRGIGADDLLRHVALTTDGLQQEDDVVVLLIPLRAQPLQRLGHLIHRPARLVVVGPDEDPLGYDGLTRHLDRLLDDHRPVNRDYLLDDHRLFDRNHLLLHDSLRLPRCPGRPLGARGSGRAPLTLSARRPRRPRRSLHVTNLDLTTGSSQQTAQCSRRAP